MNRHADEMRPIGWVLEHSISWFNALIWARIRAGDPPSAPARVFRRGRSMFGLLEWPDGRWLVLALAKLPEARR